MSIFKILQIVLQNSRFVCRAGSPDSEITVDHYTQRQEKGNAEENFSRMNFARIC